MSNDSINYDIFDPDPIAEQEKFLERFNDKETDWDLSNPQIALILAHQNRVKLTELRQKKLDMDMLTKRSSNLRDDRETLFIEVSKLKEREKITWIEFPAGIICGFSVNMLTADSSNFLGWSLLLLGVTFFLIVRISQSSTSKIKNIIKRNNNG